ncbi:hypothetical protein B0T13DRAFT_530247 [Neurospora crassa]|nr:hypothetical protein B0T13DRAFT_530247 [Neurospora crassa]
MCQTTLYKDTHCKHRWMRITTPCLPGAGFNTCPSFSHNNNTRNYHYNNHHSPNGLCHQPLCPYQQHPHPNHTPSHTATFTTPIQGQLQIQGHNTCQVHLPGPPYHQIQDNCPHHQHLVAKPAPPAYIARGEPCPECDLRGVYDRNQVRMVTRIKKGIKLGAGPSGGDPGVEVRCCVM